MNAPAKSAETAVKFGAVQFKGRVQGVRKAGNFVYTVCKLPAADEYSSPQTVEIISKSRFASVGDDFTAACTVAGYPRSYETKDKQTGEMVTIHTADHRFHLIEG